MTLLARPCSLSFLPSLKGYYQTVDFSLFPAVCLSLSLLSLSPSLHTTEDTRLSFALADTLPES